jgi:TonB family protein
MVDKRAAEGAEGMRITQALAALVGLAISAAVPGQTSSRQTPTGKTLPSARWAIDYGDKYCSLSRQAPDPSFPDLTLRLIPGHPVPELLILGAGWNPDLVRRVVPVDLVLEPGAQRIKVTAVPISVAGTKVRGFGLDGLPMDFLESFATAQMLAVEHGKQTVVAIPLTKTDKALAALHGCNDDLLKAWGVDVKAMAALKTEALPITPVNSWFRADDFPEAAIMGATSGTVVARFVVSATGAISNCEAVGSSGSKELDQQTCRSILTYGHYQPAIGPSGATVASQIVVTVNWVVPRG